VSHSLAIAGDPSHSDSWWSPRTNGNRSLKVKRYARNGEAIAGRTTPHRSFWVLTEVSPPRGAKHRTQLFYAPPKFLLALCRKP